MTDAKKKKKMLRMNILNCHLCIFTGYEKSTLKIQTSGNPNPPSLELIKEKKRQHS